MSILQDLYYRFNSWRYGRSYGCGRCHHAQWLHTPEKLPFSLVMRDQKAVCKKCSCPDYSIERIA